MFNESKFNTQFNQFTPDVFRNPLFGELRVFIDNNNQCWFIGSEVARKFGYANPHDAINKHVNQNQKRSVSAINLAIREFNTKGNPNVLLIHESGLYALAGKSELPAAKPFYDWVCNEIQNIRQYGSSMSQHLIDVIEFDPEQLYRIAQQKEEENRLLQQQNQNLQQQNNKLQGQVDLLSSVRPSVFNPLTQDERIELEELREFKQAFQFIKNSLN